jgi:hypothetical protein
MERKKRWPSTNRVEDKKRKLEEARAHGQLSVDDPALLRGKRRKVDSDSRDFQHRDNRNERGKARGRGRGRGRGTDSGWRGRGRGGSTAQTGGDAEGSSLTAVASSASKLPLSTVAGDPDESSGSDDDAPPEIITSKLPSCLTDGALSDEEVPDAAQDIRVPTRTKDKAVDIVVNGPINRPRPAQPKKAPYNPFASRPILLRNVSSCNIPPFHCSLITTTIFSYFFLKYG